MEQEINEMADSFKARKTQNFSLPKRSLQSQVTWMTSLVEFKIWTISVEFGKVPLRLWSNSHGVRIWYAQAWRGFI